MVCSEARSHRVSRKEQRRAGKARNSPLSLWGSKLFRENEAKLFINYDAAKHIYSGSSTVAYNMDRKWETFSTSLKKQAHTASMWVAA